MKMVKMVSKTCLCMCVCIYIYIYTCMHACIHTHTHTHTRTHTCIHTHTHIHAYTHTRIHTHTCTHTCRSAMMCIKYKADGNSGIHDLFFIHYHQEDPTRSIKSITDALTIQDKGQRSAVTLPHTNTHTHTTRHSAS